MDDREIACVANLAIKQVIRTKMLRAAEDAYPEWVLRSVLHLSLRSSDASLNDLDFQANYLADKGLLRIAPISKRRDGEWRIRITARGIDFLEGTVEEVGLASPAMIAGAE